MEIFEIKYGLQLTNNHDADKKLNNIFFFKFYVDVGLSKLRNKEFHTSKVTRLQNGFNIKYSATMILYSLLYKFGTSTLTMTD